MKKIVFVAVVLMLAGAIIGYTYWKTNQQIPPSQMVQRFSTLPPVASAPEQQVIDTPDVSKSLPVLESSDNFVFNSLDELINNKSLMSLFYNERMIHNIVATIDNLPSRQAPRGVMPIRSAAGKFSTTVTDGDLVISKDNAARYTPYIKITKVIKPKKLVELYIHLYPLFQQAYENIGYPKKYFNDRLIVVLENLMAAPDIKYPVRLVQPKVYYQFADNNLESRSIGQRILMRTGGDNEAALKNWLGAIKKEILIHMYQKKLTPVE